MPSNAWRRSAGGVPFAALDTLGADFPRPNDAMITSWSWCCIGEDMLALSGSTLTAVSSNYPGASRALAAPFEIAHPFLVVKAFWFNGGTATTDSADVGVYTEAGALKVSGGGTAISGANALQEVDVTDTLLPPGRYWLTYVQNGVTATLIMAPVAAVTMRVAGCAQMASAYPLPSTFTAAAITNVNFPLFGIASRTLVA